MAKLYVMRHGPAEDQAASGRDGDRALTSSGRRRVREVAQALLDAGEAPLQLASSQLVRAVQTAEIIATVTGFAGHEGAFDVRRELAPGGDAVSLARRLVAEGRKRVCVVGHEPDLSALVSALVGRFDRSLEKAMVVGLQVSAHGLATVRFVLDPKTRRFDPDRRDIKDGD